jgi:hypothetical protein
MSVQYKEWHGVQVVVVVVHSGVLIKGVKRLDFLCWKRGEISSLVFKQREGGVKANVREQRRRRAFFQREKGTARMKVLLVLFSSSIR